MRKTGYLNPWGCVKVYNDPEISVDSGADKFSIRIFAVLNLPTKIEQASFMITITGLILVWASHIPRTASLKSLMVGSTIYLMRFGVDFCRDLSDISMKYRPSTSLMNFLWYT